MKTTLSIISFLFFFLFFGLYHACKAPVKETKVIRLDPEKAASQAIEIRNQVAAQIADGLELTLWASDSLAPDPIALNIDNQGIVYLSRTNRQKNSEFDIRGHRDWMTASISFESVEDRRAFLRRTFSPENSEANSWLPDLNQDSLHDWRDLTVEKDEIWRLQDKNGDGVADESQLILEDFNEEITDVAGALLMHEGEAFVGIGPDMWRLHDTDGDGYLDQKESISHGYAVHIGFGAHGMSGLRVGPDGKIYWGIGDIGANITAKDGQQYKYPNQGIIVRSNPDGSDFEVFAAGLRNTHEFVFDEYGNIISSDNDGDHPGESERLVYIVNGSDAGWRSNWQYGKYTDPDNNGYNVWMDEEMFKPRWENQAAYIIPPIVNYHNGPTGMVYNPGTALGPQWQNKFFLVEFVGNPSRSHIWAFKLKPDGAGFALAEEEDILSGILPTGIDFGPDGALYVADWINGWGTKNYGRVWKLDVPENQKEPVRKETEQLLKQDFARSTEADLSTLLHHSDMRVRKKAQFALAKRGDKGFDKFKAAIAQKEYQMARVHGIWGIAQLARKEPKYATSLLPLLTDGDQEIVAQAAKWLGDIRYASAGAEIVPLLKSENKRVQFFAAEALGRMKYNAATTDILEMLATNKDMDLYLRHAGILALTRFGDAAPLLALTEEANRSLRIAAVVALRRMQHPGVAQFLKDTDEYIVTEAARAINDDWSIEAALPDLANILKETRFSEEALLRRAINASLRVGTDQYLELLIDFAKRKNVPQALRTEALATLGVWAKPSVLDRVDGRYRGEIERDPALVKTKLEPHIASFLQKEHPVIIAQAIQTISKLEMTIALDQVAGLARQHSSPEVRAEALTALANMNYPQIEASLRKALADKDQSVRTSALSLLEKLDMSDEKVAGFLSPILKSGTVAEKQKVLEVVSKLPSEYSVPLLTGLVNKYKAGQLPPSIQLELLEAVEASKSATLLADMKSLQTDDQGMDAFREALYGGDPRNGRNLFFRHPAAQCMRCHSVRGFGGEVGPKLNTIGVQLSREQLLEALVDPSARIAPGFGSVSLTLQDGQTMAGIILEESPTNLTLQTEDAEPVKVPKAKISQRNDLPSSMPNAGQLLSKREIRDLVSFLAELGVESS